MKRAPGLVEVQESPEVEEARQAPELEEVPTNFLRFVLKNVLFFSPFVSFHSEDKLLIRAMSQFS